MKEKILSAYEEVAESYNNQIEHKPHNAYYDRPNTLALIPTGGKNQRSYPEISHEVTIRHCFIMF